MQTINDVFKTATDTDLDWSGLLQATPSVILHDRLMTEASIGHPAAMHATPIKAEHSYCSLGEDTDSTPDSELSLSARMDGQYTLAALDDDDVCACSRRGNGRSPCRRRRASRRQAPSLDSADRSRRRRVPLAVPSKRREILDAPRSRCAWLGCYPLPLPGPGPAPRRYRPSAPHGRAARMAGQGGRGGGTGCTGCTGTLAQSAGR